MLKYRPTESTPVNLFQGNHESGIAGMRCPSCGRRTGWARTRCPACRTKQKLWYILAVLLVAAACFGGLMIIERVG